jgi:hypothetical protein
MLYIFARTREQTRNDVGLVLAWSLLGLSPRRRFEVVTSPPMANLSRLFPLLAILGHMESTNTGMRAHVELGSARVVWILPRHSVYPRGTSQR